MEIWKLSALMLTILALAYSVQGLSFTLDRDHWISDNWEVSNAFCIHFFVVHYSNYYLLFLSITNVGTKRMKNNCVFSSKTLCSVPLTLTVKMVWLLTQDEPVDETLASQVASLLKRSKSHQFYGLMGKRSGKT